MIPTGGAELGMTNHDTFPGEDDLQSSCSMDDFFDEIFNDTTHACSHTHTCNPAGPDLPHHTHTCFHVHTKFLSPTPTTTLSASAAAADQSAESADIGTAVAANGPSSKKRPCGSNREAVRKYRQKKKAQTASLEDENRQLREENQRLRTTVQDMSALEAENVKLKFLLVDLRSRIDGVLGSFPYQRTMVKASMKSACGVVPPMNSAGGGTQVMTSCGVSCDYQDYCAVPRSNGKADGGSGGVVSMESQGFGVCERGTEPCFGNTNRDFL